MPAEGTKEGTKSNLLTCRKFRARFTLTSLCLRSQPSGRSVSILKPMRKMEMCHDHLPTRPFAFLRLHRGLLCPLEAPVPRRDPGKPKRSELKGHWHRTSPPEL